MPPRAGGRFYVDRVASSSADLRLQDQGNFRIMLDIPLDASLFTDINILTLGSIYVEYTCVLSKPTIQPNFVGTCDLLTQVKTSSVSLLSTRSNLFGSLISAGGAFAMDPRSNGGASFGNFTATGYALAIPEGLWNVVVRCVIFGSGTVAEVGYFGHYATTITGGSPVEGAINDGKGLPSNPTRDNDPAIYTLLNTTVTFTDRALNMGFQIAVPSGEYRYYTPLWVSNTGDADVLLNDLSVCITSAFPTSEQDAVINPGSVDLVKRMKLLEATMTKQVETKQELKPSVLPVYTVNEQLEDIEEIPPPLLKRQNAYIKPSPAKTAIKIGV
jgi:hypothetical protein